MSWIAVVVLTPCFITGLAGGREKARNFPFTQADEGKVPTGWKAEKTGKGEGSVWKVVADNTAPSRKGYVLAQTAEGPSSLFNVCVATDTRYQNVEVIVAFKANEGKKDQGGGIVWRYQDANNYYVARMNPLEDNFRVYKVVGGKRSAEFQDAEVKVPKGEWHSLKIKMVGNHIECFLDGKKHLDVRDDSITSTGQVGLWTKADAQTSFDGFRVQALKE
jgi:hypothetical protein